MTERNGRLYNLVRMPMFYMGLQRVLGSQKATRILVDHYLRPVRGMRVLDVGSGPGSMRAELGDVIYTGIDLNADHIELARERGSPGDTYLVGDVVTDLDFTAGSFDLVMLIGVLHHIDDAGASKLISHLAKLLSARGRIVSCDGVYQPKQRLIAKLMLDLDNGENIRTATEYQALCNDASLDVATTVTHNLLNIPYDHCIMIMSPKNGAQKP